VDTSPPNPGAVATIAGEDLYSRRAARRASFAARGLQVILVERDNGAIQIGS
jgi:hypothetical protein